MLYFLRKVLGSIIAVFCIFMTMFILSSFVPGDRARMVMGQHANPTTYEILQQEMGSDRSIAAGAVDYLKNIFQGDWGRSYVSHRQAKDIIFEALPVTVKLCLFALTFALLIGITLGTWSAYKENSTFDKAIGVLSVAGFSLPHFWLAILLQVIFGLIWKILPISGSGEGQFYFYILPGLAIGIPLGMAYTRLVRSLLLEILNKPFIVAAKAWGLPDHRIFLQHVTPNFLYVLLVQAATDAAFLLGGAVVSESIFDLPGLGSTLVNAVTARDWPVAHAIVLTTAVLVAGLNLTMKFLGPLLDPRIEEGLVKGGAYK